MEPMPIDTSGRSAPLVAIVLLVFLGGLALFFAIPH